MCVTEHMARRQPVGERNRQLRHSGKTGILKNVDELIDFTA
jgi:hypothetical protein